MKFEQKMGGILILPLVLFMAIAVLYPLFELVRISFTRKVFLTESSGYGLQNYISLLTDPDVGNAFVNSVVWTAGSVALQMPFGIGLAIFLNQKFRLQTLSRVVILLPYVLPTLIIALTWKWLLNASYGFINYALIYTGILSSPISLLGSTSTAMLTSILINAWHYTPFVVICVLARLQVVPTEVYDSAKVDGASAWQQFKYITLSQIKYVVILVLLIRVIWTFKDFDSIYLLTGGGPLSSTMTLPLLIYQIGIPAMEFGKACSLGVITLLLLVAFYLIYLKVLKVK